MQLIYNINIKIVTKKEINAYILEQKIPVSFIWKDNIEYYLRIWVNNEKTGYIDIQNQKHLVFPKWIEGYSHYSHTQQLDYVNNDFLFKSVKSSFKECLIEFLYWFELNKHKCKK